MTVTEAQKKKAEDFRAMHQEGSILVLPNVWDVASAKIYQNEGFKAIATTSAGISASLGYPDGQRMSLQDNLSVVQRIARNTPLPVSADIEAGYGQSTEDVVHAAKAAIRAGAVGINLEDSTGNSEDPLFEIPTMVSRIAGIRTMARQIGIRLFINLRTDVILLAQEINDHKMAQTFERAHAYQQAGADGIFVPDFDNLTKDRITQLVENIDLPLNLIAGRGKPSLQEFEALGVSRVTFGPKAMRATFSLVKAMAQELKDCGTYQLMNEYAINYSEVNSWFKPK